MSDISIPESWEVESLGNLNSKKKISLDPSNYPDEVFEYYSIPNYLDSKEPSLVKGSDIMSLKLILENGMILFGRLNPRIEKVWIIVSNSKYRKIGSTEWIPISPTDKIDSKFLYYLEWSTYVMEVAKRFVAGSTPSRERVDISSFYAIEVPLPSLKEQKIISSILENVDNNIDYTKNIIGKYIKIKQGLMQHLLTKGIGHKSFKETNVGNIPESWNLESIDDLSYGKKGSIKIGPFGSQIKKNDMVKSGIKIYGQENVMAEDFSIGDRFIDQEKFLQLRSVEIYPRDVLITMMGSIGYCTVFPNNCEKGIMDSHLMRIQINEELCLPEYISKLIKDSDIIKTQVNAMSQGGIMNGLNSQIVKKLQIPLPSIIEQQKIIGIFDSIDKKIMFEKRYLKKIQKIKIGLMFDLLTGKVRVKT